MSYVRWHSNFNLRNRFWGFFPLTEGNWFWSRRVGCLPSQRVLRLLLCRIRNTRDNTVNQTYVEFFLFEQMAHLNVMKDLVVSGLSESRWMAVVCKERELPCGLCCPSYHNGCVAYGDFSGDLESPEQSLAGKETLNIFAGVNGIAQCLQLGWLSQVNNWMNCGCETVWTNLILGTLSTKHMVS